MQKNHRFLLCSANQVLGIQLGATLSKLGALIQESPANELSPDRLQEIQPRMVFLDFMPPNDEKQLRQSSSQAGMLARLFPHIPRVAIGRLSQPSAAIAAFRAGVTDFIDPDLEDEFLDAVNRMLSSSNPINVAPSGQRSIVLLGARAGVGTSTLAVHLASLMQSRLTYAAGIKQHGGHAPKTQKRQEDAPLSERACLLDLGMPVGDCLLYLNIRSDFHCVDAVRNLHRLDNTLLSSALAHNDTGVSALALPRSLEQMRHASHADSLALSERLREYFGLLVTDTGGLPNPQFVAGLARAANHIWLITDQSLGALVSLADLLDDLDQHELDRSSLRLVVNRYDPRYGMNAMQIAARFNLTLLGTLPDRTLALRQCMNTGKLLPDNGSRDPYMLALHSLLHGIFPEIAAPPRSKNWLAGKLLGMRRHTAI